MGPTCSIATVFATMNRKGTALACLRALASQTRPPDLVVVADNGSSDHTSEALETLSGLPFRLIIHRMAENRGNAGGVEEAMELAFAKGADGVWILDDDSIPRHDALQQLLSVPWDDGRVFHSLQIDPATSDLTWPMQVLGTDGRWQTRDRLGTLPGGGTMETRNNWTGSLVSRSVREKVGPVLGELFIRGEDEEYPWRFQQAGIRQEVVLGSILDHPGPSELRSVRIFDRTVFFEPGLADWKLYYKVRNMLWLQRRKRGFLPMTMMGLAYAWIVLRFDGITRLPLLAEAARDGILGRLGKWKRHPF